MNESYLFKHWKELFGTKGLSDFDKDYELDAIRVQFGNRYRKMDMSQIAVDDKFSFANFVLENDLTRFENRDYDWNLDLPIEEELVEGSPYDHTGLKCTNRNYNIPIPK
jgi:hypothetical protein